ncbi:maltoporin [Hahella sp. NBU794]|uniref:maltoporin n=1 Tax=Hahella sp. NBU794 TaxID=3422590 RepID=UPI003D6E76AA
MTDKNNKRLFKVAPLATAIAASLFTVNASAVEWHGYARSGIGMSDNGDQQCINKQAVGRLGNECETYAELDLQQELFNRDGRTFKVETMLSYKSNQDGDYEALNSEDDEIALRQMNVQAKGVLGFAPEATLWAGKRYYQRHDIHHLDLFYWDVSGPGAGIEGIDAGAGKFSAAWTRGYGNINILDFRYSGIQVGASSLEVGLDLAKPRLTDAQKDAGAADDLSTLLTAELSTSIFDGFNKIVFQYGTEGYASPMRNFGGGQWNGTLDKGGKGFRLIDWGVVKAGSNIELSYAAMYGVFDDDTMNDDSSFYSISARPAYKWSDYMRTYLEVGHFAADDNGVDSQLDKVTIAQAWSAGPSFWARPEIRVFASYINDGEGTPFEGGEDSVLNFGVQMEAWW